MLHKVKFFRGSCTSESSKNNGLCVLLNSKTQTSDSVLSGPSWDNKKIDSLNDYCTLRSKVKSILQAKHFFFFCFFGTQKLVREKASNGQKKPTETVATQATMCSQILYNQLGATITSSPTQYFPEMLCRIFSKSMNRNGSNNQHIIYPFMLIKDQSNTIWNLKSTDTLTLHYFKNMS